MGRGLFLKWALQKQSIVTVVALEVNWTATGIESIQWIQKIQTIEIAINTRPVHVDVEILIEISQFGVE